MLTKIDFEKAESLLSIYQNNYIDYDASWLRRI